MAGDVPAVAGDAEIASDRRMSVQLGDLFAVELHEGVGCFLALEKHLNFATVAAIDSVFGRFHIVFLFRFLPVLQRERPMSVLQRLKATVRPSCTGNRNLEKRLSPRCMRDLTEPRNRPFGASVQMGASEKKYEKSRHGEAATPFLLSHCIFQRNE